MGRDVRVWRPGVVGTSLALLVLVLLATGCARPIATSDGATVGSDPYYPELGNAGYDVKHYDISLVADPASNDVTGETRIKALATQPLASFSLDFGPLPIDAIRVNGRDAKYEHRGYELVITPRAALRMGKEFEVLVRYNGQPSLSPDVATDQPGRDVGWWRAEDGTINTVNEPSGARGWFPANDHPRDKATYRFEVTVPKPWIVAASGELVSETVTEDETRYVFEMDQPMATYLASVNVGKYEIDRLQGPGGIVVRNYFPPGYSLGLRANFRRLPEMIAYLNSLYGPYPFDEYGVLIASPTFPPCEAHMGAAEVQTLSIHCADAAMAAEAVIVHELAHQWFGNSVSLENWQDIWLKEGMATYAEWLWRTRNGPADALDRLVKVLVAGYKPEAPVGDPASATLYRWEVYDGGAFVFHALRREVGDEAFFKILRAYLDRYKGGSAGTDEFLAVAEEVSGRSLKAQFDEWLTKVGPPQFP